MTLSSLTILCGLGAYLLGSIPVGLLLGRWNGVDVRRHGSGNIGAANVGRVLGRPWGIAVFAGDMLKGFLPAWFSGQWLRTFAHPSSADSAAVVCCWLFIAICSVVGHNHSIFLGLKGGKGVSTSLGVALGIYPDLTFAALAGFVVWAVGIAVTRMSSFGSIAAAVLFPVFVLLQISFLQRKLSDRWPILAFAVFVALMIVARHRSNIKRIMSGTESKIGASRISGTSAEAQPSRASP